MTTTNTIPDDVEAFLTQIEQDTEPLTEALDLLRAGDFDGAMQKVTNLPHKVLISVVFGLVAEEADAPIEQAINLKNWYEAQE